MANEKERKKIKERTTAGRRSGANGRKLERVRRNRKSRGEDGGLRKRGAEEVGLAGKYEKRT